MVEDGTVPGRKRRGRGIRTALVVFVLSTLPAAGFARSVPVAGEDIPVRNRAGAEYVPLSRLVEALGGKFWRVRDRFVVLMPGDSLMPEREYVFWADSALVRCVEEEFELPLASIVEGDQLYLPVLGLGDLFPGLSAAVPVLTCVAVESAGDTAVVRLVAATGDSLLWIGEARSSLEYRLVVGARCDSTLVQQFSQVPVLAANGLVGHCRVAQATRAAGDAATVIHFMFRKPATAVAVDESCGVAVKIWPRPERRIQRLVLDPGHGGKDPGAVGRVGTLEKTIVLDVTLRLKKKLEAQGFEVLLTRSKDEYVSLSDRSEFANSSRADVFVSIHANAAPNRQACGFETYFLSEAKTDWERAVAARENAALEFERTDSTGMGDELELILADLAQNEFLTESSELAALIQEKTVPHARIKNRGVRQANFFVLRNNYMPAVLVECGFLSNRSEEKLLRNPNHRERLAEGICRGIVEFVRAYERRINGT